MILNSMKFIIGKKMEMTQIWRGEKVVAVTKVLAGPCPVVQLKNIDRDGYSAVQLGFGLRKEKNIKKPQLGHSKKAGAASKDGKNNLRYLREFRVISFRESRATNATHANIPQEGVKVGDIIDVSAFQAGDIIKVTGSSKGKGFQGGVKRHGWHGHNTTHGTKDQVRTSGSIGAGGIQHVLKGKRMSGRMGDERVTISNLKIAQVDKGNNILYVSGAVPGARNGLLMIYGDGELKIRQESSPKDAKEAAPRENEAVVAEKKPEAKAETAEKPATGAITEAAEKKPEAVEKSVPGGSASGGKEAVKAGKTEV